MLPDTEDTLLRDTLETLLAEARELKAEADLFKGDPFLLAAEVQGLKDTADTLLTDTRELDSLTGVCKSRVSPGGATEQLGTMGWEAQPE